MPRRRLRRLKGWPAASNNRATSTAETISLRHSRRALLRKDFHLSYPPDHISGDKLNYKVLPRVDPVPRAFLLAAATFSLIRTSTDVSNGAQHTGQATGFHSSSIGIVMFSCAFRRVRGCCLLNGRRDCAGRNVGFRHRSLKSIYRSAAIDPHPYVFRAPR